MSQNISRLAGDAAPELISSLLNQWPVGARSIERLALGFSTGVIQGPVAIIAVTAGIEVRSSNFEPFHLHKGRAVLIHRMGEIALESGGSADFTHEARLSADVAGSPYDAQLLLIELVRLPASYSEPLLSEPLLVDHVLDHDLLRTLAATSLIPGGNLLPPVRRALATAVYLHCLQRVFTSRPRDVRWLHGATDPELGTAVMSMLREPIRNWTVESLAELSGMSRSGFARKFRDLMDTSPIEFLVDLRMQAAAKRLDSGSNDLKSIAKCAGYKSPAAFGVAFKRWCGCNPSQFRREQLVERPGGSVIRRGPAGE